MTISFIAGATYSFTTTHGYDEQYVRAWIDFNNDGTFTNDTSERVASVSGEYYLEITQGIISIPSSVLAGTYRMRIATRYGTYPTPCVNTSDWLYGAYGEAHDYTVNITVPTCVTPSAVTIANTTSNSVDLGWTSDGDTFEVSWGEGSFDAEDGTIVPFVNGATLSGLQADTDYSFYVRQDCGDDDVSAWTGPYNFYTGYCV